MLYIYFNMSIRDKIKKILVEETTDKFKKAVYRYLDLGSSRKPYSRLRTLDGVYDIHFFSAGREVMVTYYSEANISYLYKGQYPVAYFDENSFDFMRNFIDLFGKKRIPILFDWINDNLSGYEEDPSYQRRFETPKTFLVSTSKGFYMLPKNEDTEGIFVFDL